MVSIKFMNLEFEWKGFQEHERLRAWVCMIQLILRAVGIINSAGLISIPRRRKS